MIYNISFGRKNSPKINKLFHRSTANEKSFRIMISMYHQKEYLI